ncbi:ATP-binding protein [Corynebacterium breve]|uniref:histidine kinase n=1 Tax=Corynebacterium breve TaxID=3049799 RepID=A0ABY8VH50_9CORY|nr:sensor histidine kinase [Corynebacterium breve]WIM68417.1 ATP-binding protein [Corynebacterium breve]
MILRKPAQPQSRHAMAPTDLGSFTIFGKGTSLRWQLALMTAAMVTIAVGAMTTVTYWTMSTSLAASVDQNLDEKASLLMQRTLDPLYVVNLNSEVQRFKTYHPDIRISVSPPAWSFFYGDSIPVGGDFTPTGVGEETSVRTVGNDRILTKRNSMGTTVVLAQNMDSTQKLVGALGAVLLVISGLGILLAIAVGMVVATAGLRPLGRLQRAVDYVAQTDDLKPIEVIGNDELAQLTTSFNEMLGALQESRVRQTRLVADAGHELKTPLTSMRTNIELLMDVYRMGKLGEMSKEDLDDLEHDVLAQMEELSALIGDLVDLAREEAPEHDMEPVELDEVLEHALDRVRRRRPDVQFQFHADPWIVEGERAALERAIMNLFDNAGKWSPVGETVRISLKAARRKAVLLVDDSGPGIPPEQRERIFERFYRTDEARAMPGSGLGLSITKQVLDRHGATIDVEESDDGGARFRVVFSGRPGYDGSDSDSGSDDGHTASDLRGELFAERWIRDNVESP